MVPKPVIPAVDVPPKPPKLVAVEVGAGPKAGATEDETPRPNEGVEVAPVAPKPPKSDGADVVTVPNPPKAVTAVDTVVLPNPPNAGGAVLVAKPPKPGAVELLGAPKLPKPGGGALAEGAPKLNAGLGAAPKLKLMLDVVDSKERMFKVFRM